MFKNNKGFMLIEVIVVSTIVVTTMVALYTSFNRLYNNYRIKNSYYDIDAIYATKEMLNSMITYGVINEFINENVDEQSYGYIIERKNCDTVFLSLNCKNLKDLYSIENMIFSKYDLTSLSTLKANGNLNQTFYEYIDYLIKYYELKNQTVEYNYIILTEIKDGDNYYYTNLRMR